MNPADVAAREAALVVPRPDLGTLAVTGTERWSWLQGLVTCDVEGIPAGEGRWGLVLTKPGKLLADLLVVPHGDVALLGVPRAALARVEEWLHQHLIMEDAELTDRSSELSWVGLHGPRAREVALRLAGTDGAAASIDVTGLGGAALVVPSARLGAVLGAAASEPGVVVATDDDWQRLRVERLVPLYGVDATERDNPHEVSLDRRCVSWSKGCYLGQEAVCMQDMRGKVKRRLVLLTLSAGEPPSPGMAVHAGSGGSAGGAGGAAVGVVGETRTATRSAVLGGAAVLAMVNADVSAPGTSLEVAGVSATVAAPG